jgi:hypothetical protein
MLVTDGVATLCIGETEYRSKFGHCQSVTTLGVDVAFAPQYCQPWPSAGRREGTVFGLPSHR